MNEKKKINQGDIFFFKEKTSVYPVYGEHWDNNETISRKIDTKSPCVFIRKQKFDKKFLYYFTEANLLYVKIGFMKIA